MHIILAPDSFKGTLSAREVCEIEKAALHAQLPEADIRTIPLSDGGEGMVEAYLNILGGERVIASVRGPLGESVEALYGLLADGSAVIEMAAAAGLPLVEGRKNPLLASSYGVGELLLHARRRGAKKNSHGLGGKLHQ